MAEQSNLDLSAKDWAMLRRLLDDVLERPESERAAWIDGIAPELERFKSRIWRLVRPGHAEMADALLGSFPGVETDQFVAAPQPTHVGPYHLLRELGAGGMARVWLAERTDSMQGRQVALKLPHWSHVDDRLAARLARERDILARIEHPNIARLYDAGVDDLGRPWLAMEYVRGERLDAYARRKALDVPARLRVFLQVVRAVAHAHAQLVVHRDLKPSNILVTEEGEVKLLDFGIAKLLEDPAGTPETELTRQGGRALTPAYAAPEQILGEPVTTAVDVYALGVVLFELLTAQLPYKPRRGSAAAMEDAIVLADVPPPSKVVQDLRLRRRIAGDLDTIVLQATKKAPTERYGTALALAEDIERHLTLQSVQARRDSGWYRMSRFVVRHRGAVTTAGLVGVVLAVASGYAAWQGVEAARQRDAAIYQQQRAQATAEFLGLLISDAAAYGEPLTMAELMERGTRLISPSASSAQPLWTAPVLLELSSNYVALGMAAQAAQLLERAEEAARSRADTDLLAAVLCTRARATMRTDPVAARRLVGDALAHMPARDRLSIETLETCGRAQALLSELDGDRTAAMRALHSLLTELDARSPEAVRPPLHLLNELARLHYDNRELASALEINEGMLRRMQAAGLQRSLGYLITRINGTTTLTAMGEIAESARQQQAVLRDLKQLPPAFRLRLAPPVAGNLVRLAQPQEALALLEQDLPPEQGLQGAPAPVALAMARALAHLKRPAEAEALLAHAESELMKAPRRNGRLLNLAALTRVQIKHKAGDISGATLETDALLARMGHGQSTAAPASDLHQALWIAAQLAMQRGDASAAHRYADDALAIARRVARRAEHSADVGQALLWRAKASLAAGHQAAAQEDLAQALPALIHGLGDAHPDTAEAQRLVAVR